MAWRRAGFRRFWTWKVRRGQPVRPVVAREVRDLIRQMCRENAGWGAPRIRTIIELGLSMPAMHNPAHAGSGAQRRPERAAYDHRRVCRAYWRGSLDSDLHIERASRNFSGQVPSRE